MYYQGRALLCRMPCYAPTVHMDMSCNLAQRPPQPRRHDHVACVGVTQLGGLGYAFLPLALAATHLL